MRQPLTILLVLCALAAGARPARAQDEAPAPADPPLTDVDATPEESPPDLWLIRLMFGNQWQIIDGSRRSAFQYQHPPSGQFLDLLQLEHRDAAGRLDTSLWWRNLGEQDQMGEVDVQLTGMPGRFRYRKSRAAFFIDPAFPALAPSSRDSDAGRMTLRATTLGLTFDLRITNEDVAAPGIARYFGAGPQIEYAAPAQTLRLTVPVGAGTLAFEPSHREFNNGAGNLPSSSTDRLVGELDFPLGDTANLGARFARLHTSGRGGPDATIRSVQLNGDWLPVDRLAINAYADFRDAELPQTLTAVATSSQSFGVGLTGYPARHARVAAGAFHERVTRETRGALGDETPHWTGGWFRARVYDPGVWTASFRYQERHLSDAPASGSVTLPSRRSLFPSDERHAAARVDRFLGNRVSVGAGAQWSERANEARRFDVRRAALDVGAAAELSDQLSTTLDYSLESWDGSRRRLPRRVGRLARGFYSDGHVVSLGAAYAVTPTTSLTGTTGRAWSAGDQRSSLTFFRLEWRRSFTARDFFGIAYQRDHFTDDLRRRLGFTDHLVLVELGRQFR